MKYRFLILPALCLALIFGCEPDRRTAQGEGYVEEEADPGVDTTEDTEYGLEIEREQTAAIGVEEETYQFIVEAARGSILEVELGQLAQEKAQMQEVKGYAQMLENDHQQANERLRNIAQQQNFTFPEMLADNQENLIEELREESGSDFDRAYMEKVLELHQKDIRKFENMQEEVQNPAIQAWITSTLTQLQQHKQQAEQILDQMAQ